jgi:hypothetical protein
MCQFGPEGLIKVADLAFLVCADWFRHAPMIGRQPLDNLGTIVLLSSTRLLPSVGELDDTPHYG